MHTIASGSPNVKWKDEFFVVRTTAADAGPTARVLEVAFALFRRGRVTWSSSTLLRRPSGVDFEASWVQYQLVRMGITPEQLDAAPEFETVLEQNLSGVTTPVWVGQFLDAEFRALARERAIAESRLGRSLAHLVPTPRLHVSVGALASVVHPLLSRDLKGMCKRYNVEHGRTTLELAIATGQVLVGMMDRLPDGMREMADFVDTSRTEARRVKARHGWRRW